LADSWNNTETKWYPIPVALGLGVIGVIQYRRVRAREDGNLEQPKYKATGPWQVKNAFHL
jgi:phosphatidylserine decarboxylase